MSIQAESLVTPLLGLAAGVSGWMAFRQRGAAGLPGCGAGSGCGAAAQSRWAKLGAIPVAGLGAGVYLLTLGVWVWVGRGSSSGDAGWARPTLLTLAVAVVGAAAWFTLLQGLVIRRVCAYCTLVHALAAAGAVLILVAGSRAWTSSAAGGMAALPGGPLLAAGVAVAMLAGGQVLIRPKTYGFQGTEEFIAPGFAVEEPPRVEAIVGGGTGTGSTVDPAMATRSPAGRMVSVLSGKVTLSTADWPLLGPADAPHVVVFLFDYTCAACRHLHALLDEARRRYGEVHGGRLAVLAVPVPLAAACHPGIALRESSNPYACAYARLALGVWRADAAKYEAYDRWLFDGGKEPPALGLARQEARRLAGAGEFDPSAPDPDVDPVIARGVALYKSMETPRVPALLLPGGTLSGHVPTAEELVKVLRRQLGG